MEDPIVGWKALVDCLNKGGLMKIGLYSDLARKHIVDLRKETFRLGIGSSNDEIKKFREQLIASSNTVTKRLLNSGNFYSMSELKDLLFHVSEHRFTIPKIKESLSDLGLIFCGFELEGQVRENMRKDKTDIDNYLDLDQWENFEKSNPDFFSGMYQFWSQKI